MRRILFLVLLALVRASPMVAAQVDAERFVGVWRYAGEVDRRADGSPAPSGSMSDAEGLLIYTANGFVAVNIMPKGRKWSTDAATLEELRETVSNGTAYAGRYQVDSAAHTVTHTTSVSLEPEYTGQRLVRSYALEGDKLVLSGTFPYQGETIRFSITWIRIDK